MVSALDKISHLTTMLEKTVSEERKDTSLINEVLKEIATQISFLNNNEENIAVVENVKTRVYKIIVANAEILFGTIRDNWNSVHSAKPYGHISLQNEDISAMEIRILSKSNGPVFRPVINL
jgi:hypothetical protein